jgi:histidinol-phosphate/aromatic aminotransferase/cobyric acid decarboxylase-like protein
MNERVCSMGRMILTGETKVLGGKPVLVSLCSPQNPNGQTWDATPVHTVTGSSNFSYCPT